MHAPIAVVGLGVVLPGANDVAEFWARILGRQPAFRRPGPNAGFDAALHLGARGVANRTYCIDGGYVADQWSFDWRRFRVPPAEAAAVNPMQLVTLEAGTQALAGVRKLARETTAVILGATSLGFQKDGGLHVRRDDLIDALRGSATFAALPEDERERIVAATLRSFDARLKECSSDNSVGSLASVAAARIAMHHDLYGAHYAVDADGASSLAALEIAVAGLASGEWDCVVTGGVSELLTPVELVAYAQLGLLSPTGRPRPLEPDADGLLLGEGAAMLALKRLDDALRDDDVIYALVDAVAGVMGERPRAWLEPTPSTISSAVGAAWRAAGADPASALWFECDAAGVASADELERTALEQSGAATGRLTSVKALVGHTRAASGAAGLVATALALHHHHLPAAGHVAATAWPGGAARAGVTSLSLANQAFHAVLSGFVPELHARTRPAAVERAPFAPLAVVGIGGIYAGAADPQALWSALVEGRDEVVDVPASRWPIDRYFDPKRRDKSSARMGSFIALPTPTADDAIRAVPQLDPTQLLALRVAEQALGDATLLTGVDRARVASFVGFMPFVGTRFAADARVGFRELADALASSLGAAANAGAIVNETEARFAATLADVDAESLPGWLGSVMVARIAHRFGFGGPHVAVESACASTLAALHAAALALHAGRCDVALAGGAWCDIAPEFYVATSRFNALSSAGISPFDAAASGFVPGEGGGIFVLKRLADAEAAGDRILGVVRAVSGSSDGKGRSVLTPSVEGESLALGRALAAAQLSPARVDYVECHGTGTALGDAVEVMSIACAYGDSARPSPLRIGTVKSNLGHLVAAAGAPALTKALLAMTHHELPPSLHCPHPNPKIDFAAAGVEVVRSRTPWPQPPDGSPRRAGVSAFGIGGSNFHVILEEPSAAAATDDKQQPGTDDAAPELFAFANPSAAACVEELGSLAAMLAEVAPEDFAESARSTRERADAAAADGWRLALVAHGFADLSRKAESLAAAVADSRPLAALEAGGTFLGKPGPGGVAVLFPGQGSQYPNMARQLCAGQPVAERMLVRADSVWSELTGHRLRPLMWPRVETSWPPADADLHAMVYVTSAAVHATLMQFGIRPNFYVGQSAGELAALAAAGALSFEDGLRAIHARTQAVIGLPLADPGCMASLSCSAAVLTELVLEVGRGVVVAADNCPAATLAAGPSAAMAELRRLAETRNVEYTPLPVSHAYHSPLIAAAAGPYRAALETLDWQTPAVPVLSTVDLELHDGDVAATIDRLVRQYTTPVRFREAIERLYADGVRRFFEAGPKWPLTTYVRATLDGRPHTAQAAIHPKVGEPAQLARLVACAFVHGAAHLLPAIGDWDQAPVTGVQAGPPPSRVAPALFEQLRDRVVAALAERTGYPPEMLELDFDLEADLGIDTVKQVEVFGRVRDELGLVREPNASLRDTNTLRKVIERFATRLELVTPPPAVAAPSRADEVQARLVAALAERTGYPPEMLELDLDLEADLGIDTVKQVEVFGRVRDELGLPRDPNASLRDVNTLRKVSARLVARLEAAPATASPTATTSTPAPRAPAAPAVAVAARDFDEIRDRVVAALAERTGYPPEMLELDLDLEADLGIDTVKQVEVFGRVRDELGLAREANVSLRELNTLRKVIDRLAARLAGEPMAVATRPAPPPPSPSPPSPVPAIDRPATGATLAIDPRQSPNLERIIERSAHRLVAERTFSLTTDRYLQDARVAGKHYVPGALVWEALAEAAELLLELPVRVVAGLYSAGPLLLDATGQVVTRVEIERTPDGARATLHELAAGTAPRVRCQAELSAHAGELEVPRDVGRALDRRGHNRNGHALAAGADPSVHLGETLAGCVWARALSFCELVGGIRADSDNLFDAVDDVRLVLAPAVLEGAFMLAGFGWYALAGQSGLPDHIERIILGRPPLRDEEVLCHVRLRTSTSDSVTADLTLLGGGDRALISRVIGCRLVRIERLIDMAPKPGSDAVSWAHFCRALQEPGGGRTR